MSSSQVFRSIVKTVPKLAFKRVIPYTAITRFGSRSFSVTPSRKDAAQDNLINTLSSEIEFEKKDSFSLDSSYVDYLHSSGFEIVETPGKALAELIKKDGSDSIHVYFDVQRMIQSSYDLKQFQNEMQNDDGDVANSSEFQELAFTDVNVVLEKNGRATGFDLSLSLVNQDFEVTAITYFDDAKTALSESADASNARELAYSGPSFSNLDDGLQNTINDYLVSKGIDNELAQFIIGYASVKENNEYISWLQNLKSFVQ